MLIDYIDKIARDKQRDVLYVDFYEVMMGYPADYQLIKNYETCEARQRLIQWCEDHGITAYPCGPVARGKEDYRSYRGQLYIDVPFDKTDSDYQKVENLLENEDGSRKIPGVRFCYFPLVVAMENAHHDELGYWDDIDA